jgi:hypothetical protein
MLATGEPLSPQDGQAAASTTASITHPLAQQQAPLTPMHLRSPQYGRGWSVQMKRMQERSTCDVSLRWEQQCMH